MLTTDNSQGWKAQDWHWGWGMLAPFESWGAPPPVCTPDTPASTCWCTCTCTGCARTPGGSPGRAGQQSQGAAGRRHDKAAHGVPNHVSSPVPPWLQPDRWLSRKGGGTEERSWSSNCAVKLNGLKVSITTRGYYGRGRRAFCRCEYRRMCDHQWQQQTYRS